MGLPEKRRLTDDYLRRIYITVIRQNWHVLPERQIMELLGWDETKYRFTLKKDDFLDVKLGRVKPACEPLRYTPPTEPQQSRAAAIRKSLTRWFGRRLHEPGEDRFAFVQELSSRPSGSLRNPERKPPSDVADLSSGWTLIAEGDATTAGASLRWFLTERMGVKLEPAAAGPREIVLRTDGRSGKDWTVESNRDRVTITGGNPATLQRAIYELQSDMERLEAPFVRLGTATYREVWSPRYLYSYFALYGDPLMEGDSAGLPDAYLERAAMSGMEGVWIQGVVNTLAPSKAFPEFGKGWHTRLRNLRALAARAEKFGMPHLPVPERTARNAGTVFCFSPGNSRKQTSRPVRDVHLSAARATGFAASISTVFREVPGLGGLFSITMSENHTNCFSHGGAWGDRDPAVKECPRCSKRTGADTIAELITTFRDGVRKHSKTAEIISYDWGWGTPRPKR